MREIKFRAWDKKYKKMIISSTKDFSIIGNNFKVQCELYDVQPMQYTGLKDKNGVEIYEGDIIHCDTRNKSFEVAFINGSYMVRLTDDWIDYLYDFYPHNSVKVIGNIYENQELLS